VLIGMVLQNRMGVLRILLVLLVYLLERIPARLLEILDHCGEFFCWSLLLL